MKAFLFLFSTLLFANVLSGQFSRYTWFLGGGSNGERTGIRFDRQSRQPQPYHGVRLPLQLQENNIIISESATGDPIFYSDGQRVVDGSHRLMPNGAGLRGTPSTMYGTSVVYDPSGCRRYFLFHGEDETKPAPRRLFVTGIDMTLPGNGTVANPLGDVVADSKNVALTDDEINLAEGVFALPKGDESLESWVFAGQRNGNRLLQYEVSASGIRLFAVYELAALFAGQLAADDPIFGIRLAYHDDGNGRGRLVIAVARKQNNSAGPMGFVRFEPATGFFVDPIPTLIADDTEWTYGLAFSPDGTKLYYSDYFQKRLRQYDFTTGRLATVSISPHDGRTGGLLAGPDGRIYWANAFSNNNGSRVTGLARINQPNAPAARCELVYNAVTFPAGDRPRTLGALPTFGSFPEPVQVRQTAAASCQSAYGAAVALPGTGPPEDYTYRWDNGETTSRADSLEPGIHTVTVTAPGGCAESLAVVIERSGGFAAEQFTVTAEDALGCTDGRTGRLQIMHPAFGPGDSLTVTYTTGGTPVTGWYVVNAARTLILEGLLPGTYEGLTTTGASGCTGGPDGTYTIGESFRMPTPSVVETGGRCPGDSLTLSSPDPDPALIYTWTGPNGYRRTGPTITLAPFSADLAGTYSVETIQGECRSEPRPVTVAAASVPAPLGLDTLVCDEAFVLPISLPSDSLRWTDGFPDVRRPVDQSGVYRFTLVSDAGCLRADSFTVQLAPPPVLALPETLDVAYCATISLDAGLPDTVDYAVSWTGDYDLCADCYQPTVFVDRPGTVRLEAVDLATGCAAGDSTSIAVRADRVLYVPNAFSPNGDGINDRFNVFAKAGGSVVEEMLIFDRWGAEVYRAEGLPVGDPAAGWSGTLSGTDAGTVFNPGAFAYVIRVRFLGGGVVEYRGWVQLVR